MLIREIWKYFISFSSIRAYWKHWFFYVFIFNRNNVISVIILYQEFNFFIENIFLDKRKKINFFLFLRQMLCAHGLL